MYDKQVAVAPNILDFNSPSPLSTQVHWIGFCSPNCWFERLTKPGSISRGRKTPKTDGYDGERLYVGRATEVLEGVY